MDKCVAVDDFLRFVGVVLGIVAAPMILFISIMATDSGTPKAYATGKMIFFGLGSLDVLGVVCGFVPRYESPIKGKRLFLYLLLRLPTYAIALGGAAFLLFSIVHR